jgi:hypothetical protein
MPTDLFGTITYLGHVPDRDAALASDPLDAVDVGFGGIETESRGGLTRPSDSRVTSQHERGTEIRNTRQFSVVSTEELAKIAQEMGVEYLDPAWLGASIAISGIDDFSHIPPSTRLQNAAGTTLVVDLMNRPCILPAPVINIHLPGVGAKFKPAAKQLRGVTCWVERPGPLAVGDSLRVHIPDQRPWSQLNEALSGK